jgi:hypothetical protein
MRNVMTQKTKRTEEAIALEAHEGDFRPGRDMPSEYGLSLMPAALRTQMEKRQASMGRLAKLAAE